MKHITKEDLQQLFGIITSDQFAVNGKQAKALAELQERLKAEIQSINAPEGSPSEA